MTPDETREIARDYFHRLLNEKDLAVCDELLSPAYVDHDAPEGTPPGPDSTRSWIEGFIKQYPDIRVQVDDLVAEDHKVALRLTWSGTDSQSKEKYEKSGIVILHFDEQGRIIERWSAYE